MFIDIMKLNILNLPLFCFDIYPEIFKRAERSNIIFICGKRLLGNQIT